MHCVVYWRITTLCPRSHEGSPLLHESGCSEEAKGEGHHDDAPSIEGRPDAVVAPDAGADNAGNANTGGADAVGDMKNAGDAAVAHDESKSVPGSDDVDAAAEAASRPTADVDVVLNLAWVDSAYSQRSPIASLRRLVRGCALGMHVHVVLFGAEGGGGG